MNTNKVSTTITVTVNIAAANLYEGNAELKINVTEAELCEMCRKALIPNFASLVSKAIQDYEERNS